ncbi:MAG: flagellar hook-associated protein FlgL [Clostridia bacterium]|nr:flagellar hook-associated protein FlgL [Clostridia bacterium]
MRITNNIMVNTSLSNLQKSLIALNNYSTQVETGKKIQTASENPVIASKSLRYRTRLYEIDQYKSNVAEANSWLSSTETTLSSTYSILKKIRELAQDCASETITDSDRTQSLIEIKELRSQLAQEANTNVAGRYIFSGYKTDTKVMFNSDEEITYNLKESLDFTKADVIDANEMGTIKGYSVKLLYGNIEDDSVKLTLKTSTDEIIDYPSSTATDEYVINYVSATDADAYKVAESYVDGGKNVHTINLIKETGEIVFNETDYKTLSNDIQVEYTKNKFSDGDLNPVHYLVCSEKVNVANPNIGRMQNNRIVLEPTEGIKDGTVRGLQLNGATLIDDDGNVTAPYTVNYVKSTDATPLGANEIRICTDSGEIRFGSSFDGDNGSVVAVNSYYKAETNPSLISSTKEVTFPDKLVGALNNSREIKLSSKGTIDVNSIQNLTLRKYNNTTETYDDVTPSPLVVKYALSTDIPKPTPVGNELMVYTDTGMMVAGTGIDAGTEIVMDKLFVTTNEKVNEEIKFEVNSNSSIVVNALAQDVFTMDLFKDLDLLIGRIQNFPRDEVTTLLSQALEDLDNHMEEVLKQNSTVGSKMNRLELISNRLADDKINFKDLQSENEDVDEAEAATNLAIQEMVYNAALQTTSKVLQTSLLDFLQ